MIDQGKTVESAFSGMVRVIRWEMKELELDPMIVLTKHKDLVVDRITLPSKWYVGMKICMEKEGRTADFTFCHKAVTSYDNVGDDYDNIISKVIANIETFIRNGSNWVIYSIKYLDLNIEVLR